MAAVALQARVHPVRPEAAAREAREAREGAQLETAQVSRALRTFPLSATRAP